MSTASTPNASPDRDDSTPDDGAPPAEDRPPGAGDGRLSAQASSTHEDIRAAKVSIDRTEHGVTMTISAGKLRLRLFIDAQWTELIQQISAGEGELGELVPFRMAPFRIDEDVEEVSTETINAYPIPGLSGDTPLQSTPLWNAASPDDPDDGPK